MASCLPRAGSESHAPLIRKGQGKASTHCSYACQAGKFINVGDYLGINVFGIYQIIIIRVWHGPNLRARGENMRWLTFTGSSRLCPFPERQRAL